MATKLYLHPDFEEKQEDWKLYRDLYEGKKEVISRPKFLWPHDLEQLPTEESARVYRNRQTRTQYTNFISPIINVWTQLFFRKDLIIPDEVKELFGDEIDDVDGKGRSLANFLREEVLKSELMFGRPVIAVDAFNISATNRLEEQSLGLRPFMESIDPLCLKDWSLETEDPGRLNRFNMVRYEFAKLAPRLYPNEKPEVIKYSKVYIKDGSQVIVQEYRNNADPEQPQGTQQAEDWQLLDEQPIPDLDEIPVAADLYGMSWLKDVAPQQLRYYNLESNLDNVRYYQGYQIKYFTGFEDGADQQKMAMSAYTALFLPEGASAGVIEPANTESLERGLDMTLNNIFKVGLSQPFQIAANSKAVQAADTQREQKDDTIALVQARQERVEDVINNAIEHYARFKNEEAPEEKVRFDSDVSEDDVEQMLNMFQALRPELERFPETKRQFVRAILKDVSFEDAEAVMEEIKGADLQPLATQRPGLLQGFLENGGEAGDTEAS